MDSDDPKIPLEIIRKLVLRLADIVDDEEPSHLEICERMMTLCQATQSTLEDDSIMSLISSLQYFDRMQQRTRYLVHLIENVLIEQPLVAEEFSTLHSQDNTSPHHADAEWLHDLLIEKSTAEGETNAQ